MSSPNLLLFVVDQLSAFALRSYGGTVCETPHLDALAARGTIFDNAWCPYPLCAPSRFGTLAGRLPSRIGAYDNGAELTASTPTFAHYLRAHGYYTCLAGKMHFVGPDQHHGFEERLTTEIYPADLSWTPEPARGDDTDGERGHGFGVSTTDTVKDAGPVARSMQMDYDEDVIHRAVRELYAHARGDDGRPFAMTVSLTHPHDPYVMTREFWDRYDDGDIEAPRVPPIPPEARDPHSRSLYYHYGQHRCTLTEGDYRRARRGYYAMISYVDSLFGRLMAALDESGFADDTVVLFTSDHGDMIGERGMWFKKTLFEPAIRVPLIVADPRRGPRRERAPVSLLDLFPTLLDLAGIAPEAIVTRLDGRTLVPALDGEHVTGPVFVEHIDGGTVAPRVGVRDGDLKLVHSRAYPPQLFDLSRDPDERVNLAGTGHPDEARLTRLAEETWPLDTLGEDVVRSQTERRLVDAALATGRERRWDFVPGELRQDARYVRRGDAFPDVERRGYLRYPDGST